MGVVPRRVTQELSTELSLRSLRDLFSRPAVALCVALTFGVTLPGIAVAGPFGEFAGSWSGNGTVRPQGGSSERIRCNATYRPQGGNDLNAHLRCASDSYNFDLTGELSADSSNSISGRWSEHSRGIGGTVTGTARGDRMQIVVESSGFSAIVRLVMQGKRQEVTIESQAGGQPVKASVAMHRS